MAGTAEHSSGRSAVTVEPGDHLCALYLGQQERDDVVLPYLRAELFENPHFPSPDEYGAVRS